MRNIYIFISLLLFTIIVQSVKADVTSKEIVENLKFLKMIVQSPVKNVKQLPFFSELTDEDRQSFNGFLHDIMNAQKANQFRIAVKGVVLHLQVDNKTKHQISFQDYNLGRLQINGTYIHLPKNKSLKEMKEYFSVQLNRNKPKSSNSASIKSWMFVQKAFALGDDPSPDAIALATKLHSLCGRMLFNQVYTCSIQKIIAERYLQDPRNPVLDSFECKSPFGDKPKTYDWVNRVGSLANFSFIKSNPKWQPGVSMSSDRETVTVTYPEINGQKTTSTIGNCRIIYERPNGSYISKKYSLSSRPHDPGFLGPDTHPEDCALDGPNVQMRMFHDLNECCDSNECQQFLKTRIKHYKSHVLPDFEKSERDFSDKTNLHNRVQ